MEMRVMDSATAAGLLGVTDRAIRKQISQGKLKTEAMRGSKGGGNCGMSNMIPVSEVLQQLDTQGRILWHESQSGLSTQVSAADLATYKEAFGEEGLTGLATMAIFKSQSVKRVVTTQGVRLNNQLFWHPEMADIIREQVTIYYNRGYNSSVSVFADGHFICEAEPVELMALIDPDEERVAAHMADQKRQQRKVTDRLAYIRQSTKWITREAYAEEIDEQRQRMATVTSLEAARAGKAKQQVADKAAGRRKAAFAGENAVRSMISMFANGNIRIKPEQQKVLEDWVSDIERQAQAEAIETGAVEEMPAPAPQTFKHNIELYQTHEFTEALGLLEWTRDNRKMCVMVGYPGIGKTTVIRELAKRVPDVHVIVCRSTMRMRDLLASIAESIGVSASGSNDERVRRIQRELAANRDTMLIFDEADHHAHPVRQGSWADD